MTKRRKAREWWVIVSPYNGLLTFNTKRDANNWYQIWGNNQSYVAKVKEVLTPKRRARE